MNQFFSWWTTPAGSGSLSGLRSLLIRCRWLELLVRTALGLVFVYAGLIKLLEPKAFARTISGYDLLPEILLPPVAVGLPLLETIAGIGLILGMPGSLPCITGLLVMFIVVIQYGILSGLEVDCGCFSAAEVADQNSLKWAVRRDLLMIIAALYLYLLRRQRRQTVQPVPGAQADHQTDMGGDWNGEQRESLGGGADGAVDAEPGGTGHGSLGEQGAGQREDSADLSARGGAGRLPGGEHR